MKRLLKQIAAMILVIVMAATAFPPVVMAALVDNDPQVNREILTRLEELCGSPQEAEGYYALLQQYGLLDEDGNAASQWEIELDGEPIDLAGLRALLEDPDCDLTRYVWVDGSPLTLEEVQTMLEVEDYIAYLRETYFSVGQWSQEQLDNLDSLVEQMNTEGIQLLAPESAAMPSGVDHSVTASLVGADTAELNSDYSFTVKLNRAQGKPVTFSYAAYSGSVEAVGSGTATIDAGSTEATVTVQVKGSVGRINGSGAFTVAVYDLKNALFANNTTAASKTVTVATYQMYTSGRRISP